MTLYSDFKLQKQDQLQPVYSSTEKLNPTNICWIRNFRPAPSSSGLGLRPFTAATRVRVPYGSPKTPGLAQRDRGFLLATHGTRTRRVRTRRRRAQRGRESSPRFPEEETASQHSRSGAQAIESRERRATTKSMQALLPISRTGRISPSVQLDWHRLKTSTETLWLRHNKPNSRS